jgi:hypothetical protein
MRQDAANEGAVGDDGDEAQGALATLGAWFHVDSKNALEQPGPTNARGRWAALHLDALLAGVGVMAPRSLLCAAKQPLYRTWCTRRRWDQGRQLLQQLQRR